MAGRRLTASLAIPSPRRGILRCRGRRLAYGDRTLVMGIINVTPDSFSGDGVGRQAELAASLAKDMVGQGADLLDVGGESTRPGAQPVEVAEEIERVAPAIAAI